MKRNETGLPDSPEGHREIISHKFKLRSYPGGPGTKISCATEQLSPCATTTEPAHPRAHALQREKLPQRAARARQVESSPRSPQ